MGISISDIVTSAYDSLETKLPAWRRWIGKPPLVPCDEATKSLFLRHLFSDHALVNQIKMAAKEPISERALKELRERCQEKTREILVQKKMEGARAWASSFVTVEGFDELAKEALNRSSTIPELKPLTSLSSREKYTCLSNLRDKRWITQLSVATQGALFALPYLVLLATTLHALFFVSALLRSCMLAITSYYELDAHPYYAQGVGPLIEEIAFRTLLQNGIAHSLQSLCLGLEQESIRKIAIVTSSLIFGFAHVWQHVSAPIDGCVHAATTFFSGLLFGTLYERYGLLASAASHSALNTLISLPLFGTSRSRQSLLFSQLC